MNSIHKILAINEKELVSNVSDNASWHADYNDTSYIYIGNLHENLAEKDILTIFSQYGNPTHINLVKDRDSKIKGFCYLKYEDQRSCVLAIDNFNGTLIYDKPLKVDHTYYRLAKGQAEDDFRVEYPAPQQKKDPVKLIESVPKLLPYEPPVGGGRVADLSDDSARGRHGAEASIPGSVSQDGKGIKDDAFSDPMGTFKQDDFSDPMGNFKQDDFSDPMGNFKQDDFSDPMGNFKQDDFSDPMASFKKDDDFSDPMASLSKVSKPRSSEKI
ncbi:hypothetical protein JCM33374_g2948 [Metschnikowia sp. JCM 33374]|nr:hypothetical protein JCM33374_g2948 [Metschnikowia sp. JCM 33374]